MRIGLISPATRFAALLNLPDLPAKQRTAFTVAIYTGMRAGEIWGLRWEDVDFEEREILVRYSFDGPTKGGKVRRIPMLPPVFEELARLEAQRRCHEGGRPRLSCPRRSHAHQGI